MKTDNKVKEIEKEMLKHLAVLNEHYKPIWAEIVKQVEKYKNPLLKIKYLQDKYYDYMVEVHETPELLYSSGVYIANLGMPQEIGMDALITLEIKKIKNKNGISDKTLIFNEAKPNNSYKFNNKEALESIFNRLKKDNYISDEIKWTEFKKIFSECKLTEILPINWMGSIASLRYFMKLFPKQMTNTSLFQITAHCFLCDGKEINEKQLKSAKKYSIKDKEKLDYIKTTYLTH